MKAIVYHKLGDPNVLNLCDVPQPEPGPGEIVFQVNAAGVNHLDIHFRRGLPGMKGPLPHTPGTDGAGIVFTVGPGVTNVKPGDRIIMNPGVGCGECPRCLEGQISYCHKYYDLGRETEGSYAQFMKIPARNAIPLPDHVSFESAAAIPVAYLTAWSMVVSKGAVKPGDTVLVMGAGSGVGMAAIQISKLIGATVITTAGTPEKAEKARELLHADHVIEYNHQEIDRECRRITNRSGVDVAIDHVGGRQWVPILRATRNGGTVVTCGATDGFDPQEDLRQIFYRQVRVLGSTMGNDFELHSVLKLFFEGKLNPILHEVLPLHEARKAHEIIESRKVFGKMILIPPD